MFLATRLARAFRWNVPKPESTTGSPRDTDAVMVRISASTTSATTGAGCRVFAETSATRSRLFTSNLLGSRDVEGVCVRRFAGVHDAS